MRRYWHPVTATAQLDNDPVQKVRILGEDLALFRDLSGTLGLLAQRCPHRMMDLTFGIPEEEGLRCPYRGWLYLDDDIDRYCPDRDTVVELYRRASELGVADVRRSF